jgi:hypothetical protein
MIATEALSATTWRSQNQPWPLLHHLQRHCRIGRVQGGKRKLRLFAVGCFRQEWHLFDDERCRRAAEVAERLADGVVTREEVVEAVAGAQAVVREALGQLRELDAQGVPPGPARWGVVVRRSLGSSVERVLSKMQVRSAELAAMCVIAAVGFRAAADSGAAPAPEEDPPPIWRRRPLPVQDPDVGAALEARQADLVRDVFGDPFRPAAIDPSWRSDSVRRLAQMIYEERHWDDLPILADALEDAGCADAAVLAHCRGGGEHARGCWLVDRLAGQEVNR